MCGLMFDEGEDRKKDYGKPVLFPVAGNRESRIGHVRRKNGKLERAKNALSVKRPEYGTRTIAGCRPRFPHSRQKKKKKKRDRGGQKIRLENKFENMGQNCGIADALM